MEYTNLGRTGLQVSRLCLGTMNFGPHTTEPDSYAIMDHSLEEGLNFFDTANVYGWQIGEGATEQIIGRWLAQGGGRRDQIVLATKVYGKMGEGVNDRRLSAYHIRKACEDSLRRLQTDRIDLYQMHHVDRSTPWEEIWGAMERLVQDGKILYVGSSNFAGWHLMQAQAAARSRDFLGLVSEQSRYNLSVRTVELEVIPACRELGIGLIPYSPLGGGLLAGALEAGDHQRRASDHVKNLLEKHHERVFDYEAFCRDLDAPPDLVALAWLLANPDVTAPIIGPRTMEQLVGSLSAFEMDLEPDAMARLDELWPGPGGEAPEAYAW